MTPNNYFDSSQHIKQHKLDMAASKLRINNNNRVKELNIDELF